MGVTKTILERVDCNILEWYGHVVRMEANRWPKRKMTWSPEGRRRRGRPEVKCGKEVERVMNQRKLIFDDAVNRQLWRLKASKWWTTGKLIDQLMFTYHSNNSTK
jgi:hypothetical protein